MRLRRVPGTKERLLGYAGVLVLQPETKRGLWAQEFGNAAPIQLEIGCGRGRFIVESARANPDINYIGLELREEMVMEAIERAGDNLPANLRFLWMKAELLPVVFAPGELSVIYLNFSDPWPKKRHAKRRLSHGDFLKIYQRILKSDGRLIMKTDNRPLFDFSLGQFKAWAWRLSEVDFAYPLKGASGDIPTEYEMRFRRRGIPICRLVAKLPKTEDFVMKYVSTRGNCEPMSGAAAIRSGMVPGGGLFVPESLPVFPCSWQELMEMDYGQLAEVILGLFLTDFKAEDISRIVKESYNQTNFRNEKIAPLVQLDEKMHILELWHGPTAAFKDMALQIMPRLLVQSVQYSGDSEEVDILVATSGDTGKAALEGFKNVPGIKIIVFYPHHGVSKAQYLQMATTDGNNTKVVAVKGNFDDCQTGVKQIFGDQAFAERMAAADKEFSSANSINWGRLLPQIIYYFWTYAQMLKAGSLQPGEKFNVCVPTGNFGNILAGYYAYEMGLPVNKFVCASNSNKVLTDVLSTGVYDRRREFVKTTSPSMDILVSSNFERFFYAMSGGNAGLVAAAFKDLSDKGIFEAPAAVKANWDRIMVGGYADEAAVQAEIKAVFEQHGYTLDPHTAVGARVYADYAASSGDEHPYVVVSTASPYKFGRAVLEAITGQAVDNDSESAVLAELSALTKTEIHYALVDVESRPILHDTVIEIAEMPETVAKILGV